MVIRRFRTTKADKDSNTFIYELQYKNIEDFGNNGKVKRYEGSAVDSNSTSKLSHDEDHDKSAGFPGRVGDCGRKKAVQIDLSTPDTSNANQARPPHENFLAHHLASAGETPSSYQIDNINRSKGADNPSAQLSNSYVPQSQNSTKSGAEKTPEQQDIAGRNINSKHQVPSRRPAQTLRECHECHSSVRRSKILRLSCQHDYCQDCVQTLYHRATQDDGWYPPRCCTQEIPLRSVEAYLDQEVYIRFWIKKTEFDAQNQSNCKEDARLSLVDSDLINDDVSRRQHGGETTRLYYNGATHDGDLCADPDIQATLELARQEGWIRCTRCYMIIERIGGCMHIK